MTDVTCRVGYVYPSKILYFPHFLVGLVLQIFEFLSYFCTVVFCFAIFYFIHGVVSLFLPYEFECFFGMFRLFFEKLRFQHPRSKLPAHEFELYS